VGYWDSCGLGDVNNASILIYNGELKTPVFIAEWPRTNPGRKKPRGLEHDDGVTGIPSIAARIS
jgi:hypothetical protein